MDARAVRLEVLRQQMQAIGAREGSLADYLDRGHPNAEQALAALDEMEQFRQQSEQMRRLLSTELAGVRTTAPSVVVEWVGWHAGILQRILSEDPGAQVDGVVSDQQVRLFVARETLEAWQKVLVGAQDYVMINDYFLPDYQQEVTAFIEMLR